MSVKKVISKANPGIIKKPRVFSTRQIQLVIIYLRYGSLERFDRPVLSVAKIVKSIKRPWTTVYTVIKRFIANGH